MQRRIRLALAVALTLSLMPGCTLLHNWKEKRRVAKEKKLRDVSKEPRLVGTVTLVNAAGAFVLIDSAGLPSPSAGTIIKSRTAGMESGELRVSEVRKRPFFIADVVKGTPQKGDQVFQ